MTTRHARWDELDPRTLHGIVRLRVDVFVVEQACPYPELDGRDVEPGTEHVWWDGGADGSAGAAGDERPAAYLRVLTEPDGVRRVGRVVTRPDVRGRGLAAALVDDVVRRHGHGPLVLAAQAHLTGFYERWGFTPTGPRFDEDGIPHVPMARGPVRDTVRSEPA
ncbi:GNAT family N-acetyltransferase [Thalassiella azotivora]